MVWPRGRPTPVKGGNAHAWPQDGSADLPSAGAVFPTSDSVKISKRLGTRHRAALGISEQSDCLSLIVSEETGRISIAIGGVLHYNLTLEEFKMLLLDELRPKEQAYYEFEEAEDEKTEE